MHLSVPCFIRASLLAQMVKNLPAVQETCVWSLGWVDLLEEGMATHSHLLAYYCPQGLSPGTEVPCRLQSMGLQWVGHDWVTKHSIAQSAITYYEGNYLLDSLGLTDVLPNWVLLHTVIGGNEVYYLLCKHFTNPNQPSDVFQRLNCGPIIIPRKYRTLCALSICKDAYTYSLTLKFLVKGFPGGSGIKNPPANAGDMSLIIGLGRSHMLWSN